LPAVGDDEKNMFPGHNIYRANANYDCWLAAAVRATAGSGPAHERRCHWRMFEIRPQAASRNMRPLLPPSRMALTIYCTQPKC
jgi:hypothetical protein